MGAGDDDGLPRKHHVELSDRLARGGCADEPGDLRGVEPDARPGRRIGPRDEQPDDLTYRGEGLWSREEDIYNPMRFAKMSVRWARVAAEHGRLSEEGQVFLTKLS